MNELTGECDLLARRGGFGLRHEPFQRSAVSRKSVSQFTSA